MPTQRRVSAPRSRAVTKSSRTDRSVRPALLAVVGMSGTGKSEAAAYLRDHFKIEAVYMGGIILDEVKSRKLPVTQESERLVREELRSKHGMSAIAQLALVKIRKGFSESNVLLLDGLYSREELHYFRQFSDEFSTVVVAIHADKQLRYERLQSRPFRPLTPVQVDQRDSAELDKLNKADPIVLADYHICNNSSVDAFEKALSALMKSLRLVRIT